ncbi:MAG: UDP-glucose 4-epimerase GalE [Rhodoferax sp.]|nr:UDP-glucose 4-epimerase GalE [Rhodoferax sp.]
MHKDILITGGAGYIGSHTCVELLQAGYAVTVLDNYCNSKPEALKRVEQITGKTLVRVQGDVRDQAALEGALRASGATAVIHFAGLKSVTESMQQPQAYYDNNVVGSLRVVQAMQACGVKTLVFSSSATVYGTPEHLPVTENHPLRAASPYGQSKLDIENMLRDCFSADTGWRIAMLRYFNPVGAHASGLIGEDPGAKPGNLLPAIAQVACGRREFLNVWGADYETPDGTGVRDFIHVSDLALGHLRALEMLDADGHGQCTAINLATGTGHSVLEMVRAFEQASCRPVPFRLQARRDGDVGACYADPTLARQLLGLSAPRGLKTMCEDAWRWQSQNPHGYDGPMSPPI